MKAKLLHLTGFLMALSGGVLAVSDQIKEIAVINPKLGHAWMLVLVFTMALDRFGKLMGWHAPKDEPKKEP